MAVKQSETDGFSARHVQTMTNAFGRKKQSALSMRSPEVEIKTAPHGNTHPRVDLHFLALFLVEFGLHSRFNLFVKS
jgi:hypothetical protein